MKCGGGLGLVALLVFKTFNEAGAKFSVFRYLAPAFVFLGAYEFPARSLISR
jgi:hypothetical protein